MQVLSIFNTKGGVGKTAAAVNLGCLAAREGLRVLIWDLDPQGATSFYFRVRPKVKGGGKNIVKGKGDLDDLIKSTDFENLDLLPADFSYRELDLRLAREKQTRLRKLLAPLAASHDLVILDCPPSMSELSQQIFRASDLLLVPHVPTTLSLRTLEQLLDFLEDEKLDVPVRIFFSLVDRRKTLHREIVDAPPARALATVIPASSAVERMGIEQRPVVDFAPRSAPSRAFEALWSEVRAVLRRS